jgi:hypothetical protein
MHIVFTESKAVPTQRHRALRKCLLGISACSVLAATVIGTKPAEAATRYCPAEPRTLQFTGTLSREGGAVTHPVTMFPCEEYWAEVSASESEPNTSWWLVFTTLTGAGGPSQSLYVDGSASGLFPGVNSIGGHPFSATLAPDGVVTGVRVWTDAWGWTGGMTYSVKVHLRPRQPFHQTIPRVEYNTAGLSFGTATALTQSRLHMSMSANYYANINHYYKLTLAADGHFKLTGSITNRSANGPLSFYASVYDASQQYQGLILAASAAGNSGYEAGGVTAPVTSSIFTNTGGQTQDYYLVFNAGSYGRLDESTIDIEGAGVILASAPAPATLTLFLDADGNFNPLSPDSDREEYVPGAAPVGGASVALPQRVRVFAAYVNAAGMIVPPPTSGNVTFSLSNVSAFAGIAMNASDPRGDSPPQPDFMPAGSGVSSFGADYTAKFELDCLDYGGFATITAEHGVNSAGMRLPRDTDGNLIPDVGWVLYANQTSYGQVADSAGLDANIDDDTIPSGDGTTGDGLINYEEYRGFIVSGEHRRTNVYRKDLFIWSDVIQGLGFSDALPLTRHRIQLSEVDQGRTINFQCAVSCSGPGATHTNQDALLISPFPSSGPNVGETDCPNATGLAFVCNPNSVGPANIKIFLERIRVESPPSSDPGFVDPPDSDAISKVIAHEIGHGVDIAHYTYVTNGRLTVMALGFEAWPDVAWSNIPHTYDADDLIQLRVR